MNEKRAELVEAIQAAVRRGRLRFTVHSLQEATAEDIAVGEVRDAIPSAAAEIVENYPEHRRGPCCLLLGQTRTERPLHVVISYPPDVAVITVYMPDPAKWLDYRKRR